jgi:hypothetical protein
MLSGCHVSNGHGLYLFTWCAQQPRSRSMLTCCVLPAAFHPHQDDDYKAAGATIVDKATSFKADIVLKVKPPSLQEADLLKERAR